MRAAVIGCGAIAEQHLPFLAKSPRVELVAVCDSSPVTADFARKRFGAGLAFTDAARMLAEARPEAVHVLTPPHTHSVLARACIDAGAHVICEKPMAADAEETATLLSHAEQNGRMLFESRNYLFNDPVMRVRKAIEEGQIGAVREVDLLLSVDFLSGPFGDLNLTGPGADLPGGAIHDFLPHLAYLFLHFAPDAGEIENVAGRLGNLSGNSRAGFDFVDALVLATTARGRIRITADVRPETFRVAIRGTKASIESDLFNPYFRYEGPPDVGKRSALGQLRGGLALMRGGVSNFAGKVMQHGSYHGMPRMLDAFYAAFSGEAPPPFGPDEMIAGAKLVDRIVALRDGRR